MAMIIQQVSNPGNMKKAVLIILFWMGSIDDHHIVPSSWRKENIQGNLIHSILNRTPLSAETNRDVINDKLPNK